LVIPTSPDPAKDLLRYVARRSPPHRFLPLFFSPSHEGGHMVFIIIFAAQGRRNQSSILRYYFHQVFREHRAMQSDGYACIAALIFFQTRRRCFALRQCPTNPAQRRSHPIFHAPQQTVMIIGFKLFLQLVCERVVKSLDQSNRPASRCSWCLQHLGKTSQ